MVKFYHYNTIKQDFFMGPSVKFVFPIIDAFPDQKNGGNFSSQHYRVNLETCDLWDIYDNFWWQFLMTIFDDNFLWQFFMTFFNDNFWWQFWWQFLMTIFDGNFWWQFLKTIFDDNFDANFWWPFFMTIFYDQFFITIFDDNFW